MIGRCLVDTIVQYLVLNRVRQLLNIEVGNINRSHKKSLSLIEKGVEMREVKNLADTLRGTIAQLRTGHAAALTEFGNEVRNSNGNLAKVRAMTKELAAANRDVESMLGDAGSNFQEEDNIKGTTSTPKSDVNGVTVNKG